MTTLLDNYISFLPSEGQEAISIAREECQEPLSILSAIHWVAHHKDVDDKLGRLLVGEINKILDRLGNSNNSSLTVKSAAALTLTPDRCFDICFHNWEDYEQIQQSVKTLERFLGRRMYIRPNHIKWPTKKTLITRLQEDSANRKKTPTSSPMKKWNYQKDENANQQ